MAAITFTPRQHKNNVADKAERDGYKVGKVSGLLLTHCLNELFIANMAGHWTDAELVEYLNRDYPERKGKFQSMTAYRAYFNAGLHGFGFPVGKKLPPGKRARAVRPEQPAKAAKADKAPAKGKGDKAPKAAPKAPKAAPKAKAEAPSKA
jgi:hypothetical protein